MKVVLILGLLFSVSMAWAQDSSIEDLPAVTESEDVDGLTLEAPAGFIKDNSEEQNEASLSSETDTVEDTETPATSSQATDSQATTEEILAEKGMLQNEDSSEPAPAKVAVDLGDVVGEQKYKITCTLNDDVRVISAIAQADGSVGVVYTKFGETKTIALAKKDPAYADQVAEKIQNNLANGQYPYACTKE
jgi:hypothetical protein